MLKIAHATHVSIPNYRFEQGFLSLVTMLPITGFWKIYFGAKASPNSFQHLHVIMIFSWLMLLFCQLRFVAAGNLRS